MKIDWRGIYPAVTTQFGADETLDLEATRRGIARLVDDGVHGIILMGTVGENCSLDATEKRAVTRAGLEAAGGRVPVLSGVAEYTTNLARAYARDCEKLGLDGLMVLPGMVYKSDARETLAHFRAVAGATGLPLLLYNNPVAYGVDMRPETLADLADVDNIRAVKESSEDPRRISDIANLCGDRFTIMAGVDDVALESLMLGAAGWVSGLADVFPRESVRVYELAIAGRFEEARAIYRWMMPTLHMDTSPKLVQMIKLAEQIAGRGSEIVRAPRLTLEGEEREHVTGIIEHALANRPAI